MILVINAGSSSIKYTLFDTELHVVLKGVVEEVVSYEEAFEQIVLHLKKKVGDYIALDAIAHRVVHGGGYFKAPVLIDSEVQQKIEELIPLAPLHNSANLKGIKMCEAFFNGVKQFGIFDTAFHQSMPPKAYRYPLKKAFYEKLHVRKYGFHGISHQYLLFKSAKLLEKAPEALNLITLHVGNGVSACAIKQGRSVDTTMGLTPLEGLMMGSRCGSIDPAIAFYLMREAHMQPDEVEKSFNKESGLKGVASSSDMRQVLEARERGDEDARLAIELYVYRLQKVIGEYMAILPRVDAIIFSGGVGEHAKAIRDEVCASLVHLGVGSTIKVLVIATDEEYQMAQQVKEML